LRFQNGYEEIEDDKDKERINNQENENITHHIFKSKQSISGETTIHVHKKGNNIILKDNKNKQNIDKDKKDNNDNYLKDNKKHITEDLDHCVNTMRTHENNGEEINKNKI